MNAGIRSAQVSVCPQPWVHLRTQADEIGVVHRSQSLFQLVHVPDPVDGAAIPIVRATAATPLAKPSSQALMRLHRLLLL